MKKGSAGDQCLIKELFGKLKSKSVPWTGGTGKQPWSPQEKPPTNRQEARESHIPSPTRCLSLRATPDPLQQTRSNPTCLLRWSWLYVISLSQRLVQDPFPPERWSSISQDLASIARESTASASIPDWRLKHTSGSNNTKKTKCKKTWSTQMNREVKRWFINE